MKREFTIVVETKNEDEGIMAHALFRLGVAMLRDHDKNPNVKMEFKDTQENANNEE